MCLRLRNEIQEDVKKEHEETLKEYDATKAEEEKLQE